mmetsp:Transcript_27169/g.45447  ORF Transcript_27169/g.45447 Transcript_27169/m.45447 type:complete len:316 (+) Transcript_27169:1063-2010(+)
MPLSMGTSSSWKADIMFLIRSPPKMRKMLSSKDRKKRVDPASPWRPERPRSWLSMRRDSCRSVPTTCSPPSCRTTSRSSLVTTLYSATIASNAARSPSSTGSCVGAFSQAKERRSSTSSSASARLPHPISAASDADFAAAMVCSLNSHGKQDASAFHSFLAAGLLLSFLFPFSKAMSSSTVCTVSGYSISRSLRRAMKLGLPPSKMSVPRPAMFVEMVTAPLRPLWLTISLSRCTFSGLALSSWKGISSLASRPARNSLRSTDVVPTSTGRPLRCMRFISAQTAFHFASSVLNTTSVPSSRQVTRLVGTTATARL